MSQAMHVVSLLRNRSLASNSAKSWSILGLSRELLHMLRTSLKNCNQLSHTSDMADVSPLSNNKECPLLTLALVTAPKRARLPLNQGTALVWGRGQSALRCAAERAPVESIAQLQ